MAKDFTVTPWEVSGEIDYDKLITEFGVKPLDDKVLKRIEKHTGELHYFLKRKIFFAHTYFDTILDEVEKKLRDELDKELLTKINSGKFDDVLLGYDDDLIFKNCEKLNKPGKGG